MVQAKMTFITLPVKNLNTSVDFFTALGFEFNPQFTDENATCLILNDTTFVMLVVEPFFKNFTKKDISDATTTTESILGFSAENRDEVDAFVEKALASGGSVSNDKVDHGFMYSGSFQDPDGHLWEVMYMDPNAVQ
ncbi:VOC family protein [Listeria rocourtiae]|uniref:VOC family protein n=1 Tax=Listeria rocourtiae TaxID=647910 RepID=UPI003D2F66F5